jgi:epoxyqueuosine reductase
MFMNDEILSFLAGEALDLVGFARLDAYENDLVRTGGNIVRGYGYGISLGIVLPDSIVDHLPDRADPNVACEYRHHCYTVINERLSLAASRLASFLNKRGHRSLPIVAAEASDGKGATATVSHKMIAHIAGLGWIGKNCLLVTPEHGPRVRFISVLTRAPLLSVDDPIAQRCGDCAECVTICPVQAIKGRNFEPGEGREDRFDFGKCSRYFDELYTRDRWGVCGLCLYACPYGMRGQSRAS